jgi:lysophospholipase L1-like esterase
LQKRPTEAPPSKAPTKERPKKRYVVAALGDSITDAKSGGGGFLKVMREKCPESVFVNFGKGGDMTNQMRRRFERDIRPQIKVQKFNTLLVYGGVNDLYSDLTANRTNDRIEGDLSGIYKTAKADGLEVIAVTVSPWGGFSKYWIPRRGENTKLLNSWILGQVATGLVDKAVDSFAPLSCGNPDVLCPEYESRFHDGLHPGEVGHKILGEKLAQEALSDCL